MLVLQRYRAAKLNVFQPSGHIFCPWGSRVSRLYWSTAMFKKLSITPDSWDRIIGILSVTLLVVGVTIDVVMR